MSLYLGWDVGAWNCAKKRQASTSQDALCFRNKDTTTCWSGNISSSLESCKSIDELVESWCKMLDCPPPAMNSSVVIAIDAALTMPTGLVELCNNRSISPTISNSLENSYLYRDTERFIKKQFSKNPLSPVIHMIGSQMTKAIHFLHKFGFKQSSEKGVWVHDTNAQWKVIETYPALISATPAKRITSHDDEIDAYKCAIVAELYTKNDDSLFNPDSVTSEEFGWIWVPKPNK